VNLSALPELLLAWVKSQGTALLQGSRVEQLGNLKVGGEYPAKVLDLLPGGRHLVQVAGQKFDMGLPQGTRSGDSLRLTFTNAGPRPTFLLQQGAATPVRSVQISHAAQQIDALLRLAQPTPSPAPPGGGNPVPGAQATGPGNPSVNPQTTPQTGGSPVAIAARLAPAVSVPKPLPVASATRAAATSPMPRVAQAPPSNPGVVRPIVANVLVLQAQGMQATSAPMAVASANTALQGQAVDALRAAMAATTTLRPTVLADPAAPDARLIPMRLAQAVRESGLFYEAHLARWVRGGYPFEALRNEPQARLGRAGPPTTGLAELRGMPEEAARLAGHQLHMLEGAPFQWQGLAWPGQGMEWRVWENPDRAGGDPGVDAAAWETELRLVLPRLGEVHALLRLRGRELSLDLKVGADVARGMRTALPALHQDLEEAGLHAVRLSVEGAA